MTHHTSHAENRFIAMHKTFQININDSELSSLENNINTGKDAVVKQNICEGGRGRAVEPVRLKLTF